MTAEFLNFREYVEGPPPADWEVVSLYHRHPPVPVREIARRTGKSVGEVYRTLGRAGGFPDRRRPSHDDVLDYAGAGVTVDRIAELTGYTPRNVRYILSNKNGPNDDRRIQQMSAER